MLNPGSNNAVGTESCVRLRGKKINDADCFQESKVRISGLWTSDMYGRSSEDPSQRVTYVNSPFKSVNQLISWSFQILSLYRHLVVFQKRSILRKLRINVVHSQMNGHPAGDCSDLEIKPDSFGMQDCNSCLKQIVCRRCLGGSISKMDSKNISLIKLCQREGFSNY